MSDLEPFVVVVGTAFLLVVGAIIVFGFAVWFGLYLAPSIARRLDRADEPDESTTPDPKAPAEDADG